MVEDDDGAEVVTARGLAENGDLRPVQRAFIEHDGHQCGYCTPIHVTEDILAENIELDDDEIRGRMSGSLCDLGEIDVVRGDEEDSYVNPMGSKGIGEIGIGGSPTAVANAVYHATGTSQ